MVSRNLSERDIVKQQFLYFGNNYYKCPKINRISGYKAEHNIIGFSSPRINFQSYREVYADMVENDKYYLIFIDGSILNMEYLFEGDIICKHTLSFYPSCNNELGSSGTEDLERYGIEDDIGIEKLQVLLSNYIRVDFDEVGREEYFHSLVHMHASVFKQSVRLPVESYILPLEFICFVLKYIYRENGQYLDEWYAKLQSDYNLFNPRNLLTESELKRFRLHFR